MSGFDRSAGLARRLCGGPPAPGGGRRTATAERAWTTGLGLRNADRAVTLADLVLGRWREVEVHRVDLGLGGAGWESLAADFVDVEWERAVAALGERVPAGTAVVLVPGDRPSRATGTGPAAVVVRGSPGVLLGWMFGRGGDPSWPDLPPLGAPRFTTGRRLPSQAWD